MAELPPDEQPGHDEAQALAREEAQRVRDGWFARHLGEGWRAVGGGVYEFAPTPPAKEEAGAKPTPEGILDELADALDPERRTDSPLAEPPRADERRHGLWRPR